MAKTIVPIGPYHPLQEEPEFFTLTVEGERIVDVDVRVGYNHRGIEKLSEMKTYDQSAFVVERICGICSTSHPFAFTRAVEDVIPMEVPERAKYIRTIIAEGERVHSHLLWLGLAGHFLGYNTVFMWAWKLREEILDVMEIISGNRQNYAMFKPGGVRRDIKKEDIPIVLKKINSIIPTLEMLRKAVMDDPVLQARTKGIGILTKEEAVSYAALGPTARASGVAKDVRKNSPYEAYDRIKWDMIVRQNGDVFDKLVVRILETFESIKILQQCFARLPEGEIDAKIKDIPPDKDIEIRNLLFQYEGPHSEKVLNNISLVIPAKKVTAIVGISGSGKTTLIKLLLGFYNPANGDILLGGTQLNRFSQSEWRKRCGVVMQEGYIFSDTIAGNIGLIDEIPEKEKIDRATETANIKEFVESLPLGYNTRIGNDGHGLSTGQKQRILIARAVYKEPDFIFFDEATNALDSRNEKTIMENLGNFFKGKTVVVVAHRLSTVKNADQIVVLEKGEVVEKGTHKELVKMRGAYYNLVKDQLELGT